MISNSFVISNCSFSFVRMNNYSFSFVEYDHRYGHHGWGYFGGGSHRWYHATDTRTSTTRQTGQGYDIIISFIIVYLYHIMLIICIPYP